MTCVALIKLLLLSLSIVGVVRLLVVAFVGDDKVGPGIGRIIRRFKVSFAIGAGKDQRASERPNPPLVDDETGDPARRTF